MGYRIGGIVRFYNHVRQSIAQPMTEEQKKVLISTIKQNVQKIEELCDQCNIRPENLPARSRVAYYYLKNFDEAQIKAGTSSEHPTAETLLKPNFGEDKGSSQLFQNAYAEMFNKTQPQIVVDYYPYSCLKSTVRNYGNVVYVRLSDALKDAPDNVKKALAVILLCKLERAKCPPEQKRIYKNYLNTSQMLEAHNKLRRYRGEKIILSPKGHIYNLENIFERLNKHYFNGQLKKPHLTWSEQKTHYRLGHEDSAMDTIVISKSLDHRNVPFYVVDYIMYHEMLHIKHGTTYKDTRRHVHTKEFRADERKFTRWRTAEEWIKHNRV